MVNRIIKNNTLALRKREPMVKDWLQLTKKKIDTAKN